jgi:hypothetical protein
MTNLIIRKEAKPKDLVKRTVDRAIRDERRGGPPKLKRKKILTPETIRRRQLRESRKRKAVRLARIVDGLCPYCGQERQEDFRMCSQCRGRWRVYNERARIKRVVIATYGTR